MSDYQPPSGDQPPTKKPSLWQRFKRWPLIARIGTIGCGGLVILFGGLLLLAGLAWLVDPEGMQETVDQQEQERQEAAERESQEAEEEASREAEAAAAEDEEEEAQEDATEDESPEPETVSVPDVSGQPGDEARDSLQDEGFDVELVSDGGAVVNAANWEVESTSPAAGEDAEEGSEVTVNVVRPEDPGVEVPDVIGLPGDEAEEALEDAGFNVEFSAEDSSVVEPANWEVESTDPESGAEVDEGSEVTATVVRPDGYEEDEAPADESTEIPDDIEGQADGLGDLDTFKDAEVFFSEATGDYPYDIIFVDQEIEMDLFVSTVCTKAQEQTIEALEFARDYIPGDYDQLSLSFITRGEPDATGDRPIIGIATVVYERDTVQSIDSDAVDIGNVWEARDEGTPSRECE